MNTCIASTDIGAKYGCVGRDRQPDRWVGPLASPADDRPRRWRCARCGAPGGRAGSASWSGSRSPTACTSPPSFGGLAIDVAERPRQRRAGHAEPARRRRRPRPGRDRPVRRRRRRPRAAQRQRRRTDLARGRRRPPPDARPDPAPRGAAAPGRPAPARRWPSPAPSSGRSPASWRRAGCPARRRRGPPAARAAGGARRPAVRRRRRRRPCPRRPALGRHGARRWSCSPPRLRRVAGAGRARATGSAAWRCGACAPSPSTSSPSPWSSRSPSPRCVARRPLAPRAARRAAADLVSQLRFAVTMQDLRTVVLLRRQLRGEQPRTTPWVRHRHAGAGGRRRPVPSWRRGCAGSPATRPPGSSGWPPSPSSPASPSSPCSAARRPLVLGVGVALYLLGLDAIEPLSQEIDHPDLTDGVPRPAGLAARCATSPRRPSRSCRSPSRRGDRRRGRARPPPPRAGAVRAGDRGPARAGRSSASCATRRPARTGVDAPPCRRSSPGFTSTIRLAVPLVISTIAGAHRAGDARVPRRRRRPCGWPCSTSARRRRHRRRGCAGATSGAAKLRVVHADGRAAGVMTAPRSRPPG